MLRLKPISIEAVESAIAKAQRYRLLNEPREAESICRDVLLVDPENQEAVAILLLALTDQFGRGSGVQIDTAQAQLAHLHDEYEREYYAGLILERWGKSLMSKGIPPHVADDWLREAMRRFEKAEDLSPAGNDDAILRWNTCARIIEQRSGDKSRGPGPTAVDLHGGADDEVPFR